MIRFTLSYSLSEIHKHQSILPVCLWMCSGCEINSPSFLPSIFPSPYSHFFSLSNLLLLPSFHVTLILHLRPCRSATLMLCRLCTFFSIFYPSSLTQSSSQFSPPRRASLIMYNNQEKISDLFYLSACNSERR